MVTRGDLVVAELENGYRWWLRYIVVPLIGGGALVTLVYGTFRPEPEPSQSKVIDDTEYLVQKYTTENDGRKSKSLTCPAGKVVVPNSAKCMNTAGNPAASSEQISSNTWRCEWPYQERGIGIWVEMACKSPP